MMDFKCNAYGDNYFFDYEMMWNDSIHSIWMKQNHKIYSTTLIKKYIHIYVIKKRILDFFIEVGDRTVLW